MKKNKKYLALSIVLVLLISYSACLNKNKNKFDSIITPKNDDVSIPSISSLKSPNWPLPLTTDFWPGSCSVFYSGDAIGDSMFVWATFVDDRKLDRCSLAVEPAFQLSKINNGWFMSDVRGLPNAHAQGYEHYYHIQQGVDAGFYKFSIFCWDSAGNAATPISTYFILRVAEDQILPKIHLFEASPLYLRNWNSPDTVHFENNNYNIGDTVFLHGYVSDNLNLKYRDLRIFYKNSRQLIKTLSVKDSIGIPHYKPTALTDTFGAYNDPYKNYWVIPAGAITGVYKAMVRVMDEFNNSDSLTVEFTVNP